MNFPRAFPKPFRTLVTGGLLTICIGFPLRDALADDLMPLFSPAVLEANSSPTPRSPSPISPSSASVAEPPPINVPASPGLVPSVVPDQLPPLQEPAPGNGAQPRILESAVPLESLQIQKEQRFQELRRQLEILNQILPGTGPQTPLPPTPMEPELNGVQEPAFPSSPTPPANSSEPRVPEPMEQLQVSESPELVSVGTSPDKNLSDPIVEGVIDRFALATSLFGAGNFEMCLDVLKHTDLTKLPAADRIWGEYMQACCHRQAGRLEIAQQIYRRLLAEEEADWIGELARWWLDNLDQKKHLQADVQNLSQTLTAWETELDNLKQQSHRTTTDP